MWLNTIDDHINLIQTTKRLQLNMTKFFYNPISLTSITREFFPYLQTLYLYKQNDNNFKNDKRIIKREFIYMKMFFKLS